MSSNDIVLEIEFAEDSPLFIIINEKSTIQNLKVEIKNKLNINCEEQVLISKGDILQNDKLIKDYKITNNNRIILMIEENVPNADESNADDDSENEDQIIPYKQQEENPNDFVNMNYYIQKKYGLNSNVISSFYSSDIGKKMLNNMISDPEACYDLFQNPIMKKIFGNEPFGKLDYNNFKNFIGTDDMRMLLGQYNESKPQNLKNDFKKNFS